MCKIRLIVRSTEDIQSEIASNKEILKNADDNLYDAKKLFEIAQRDIHNTKMDVGTFESLKEKCEKKNEELHYKLGQNNIYEQMLDQGIIGEQNDAR
tara:strand:+ start:683 stop:973 length:291 start_codon:yes stop_codon:yes gene_type:complete